MMPTPQEMRDWFNSLNATDRQTMDRAERTFARAAKPLLKQKNLIDDSTTDDEVVKALRMRF
jgi:hypothetical protein